MTVETNELSTAEAEFIKTLAKAQLLKDLSFEELITEVKRRYELLLEEKLLQATEESEGAGLVVAKVNPTQYSNVEAEES